MTERALLRLAGRDEIARYNFLNPVQYTRPNLQLIMVKCSWSGQCLGIRPALLLLLLEMVRVSRQIIFLELSIYFIRFSWPQNSD